MAKAVMTTKAGTSVTIDGSPDEVAALLGLLEGTGPDERPSNNQPRVTRQKGPKATPMGLLSELIVEGFFAEPRELGAVKAALKERGHFYPVTTLSPVMLRLVRKKELRRIKDKKRWTYVG